MFLDSQIFLYRMPVGTSRLPAGSGIAVGEERVFSVVKSFKEDFCQMVPLLSLKSW